MKQLRFFCLCFLSAFLIWEAQGLAYVGMYGKIEIKGKERFVGRVKGALNLIEEKAPEAWVIVKTYVKKIEEGASTGMFPYLPGAPAVISPDSAFCSVAWCAGAIIHDALHAKFYEEYRRTRGMPVPDSAWSGPLFETKCIEFQARMMRQMGAVYAEVEYWRSRSTSAVVGTCAGDCPHA